MIARLLCWLLGHVALVSYWSVPANAFRCGRCRRTVSMRDGDVDSEATR